MCYLNSFSHHLRHVVAAASRRGLTGEVKLGSVNAVLRQGNREVEFLAQFLVRNPDGSRTYSMQYTDDALGFVGWLPYFNKRWVEAHDKLAFKQRCVAAGLPTPLWSLGNVSPGLADFVVKGVRGSFGQSVRGPYLAAEAAVTDLRPGEYAERFVAGQIGKVWYWNDAVVALELREPTFLTGNGHSTLAQLVRYVRRRPDTETINEFFRYRGLRWDNVPAVGEKVTVDFKYGSNFGRIEMESANRLHELESSAVLSQLRQWGPIFWSWVPEMIRKNVLYTVDFVLPEDGKVVLLEMNCNPTVPPEAYESIIADTFEGVAASYHGDVDDLGSATTSWGTAVSPPFEQVAAPVAPLAPTPRRPGDYRVLS